MLAWGMHGTHMDGHEILKAKQVFACVRSTSMILSGSVVDLFTLNQRLRTWQAHWPSPIYSA